MKTSEVLRKAGDVLRERGWCQGNYSKDGKHCAIGANYAAVNNRGDVPWELLDNIAEPDEKDNAGGILRWNDEEERTEDDVKILLDAAYILALQEEGVEPEDVL